MSKSIRTTRRRVRDSGAVLLTVLLVMLGLMGLGMTALWMTTGNLQVGANVNLRANALYVAEAGVERAREILNFTIPEINVNDALAGFNPSWDEVPTAVNAQGQPNGVGSVLVDGGGTPIFRVAHPPGGRAPGVDGAPTSTTMGTYTVWIRNDSAELRQNQFVIDGNQSVVVRVQGMAADGRTNVVLEVTLGTLPMGPTDPATPGPPPPVLCNSGKNACDDNSSTQYGIVVN